MNEIAELFQRITLGVYAVGVAHEGRRDAFTAAWVMQVSYHPLLLAVSVNPDNASHPILMAAGSFALSVLKREQLELARRLGTRSGHDQDKLAGIDWWPAHRGAPVLKDALAYFECELTQRLGAGDHELVVAHVIGGRIVDRDAAAMTYADTGSMDGSSSLYPVSF